MVAILSVLLIIFVSTVPGEEIKINSENEFEINDIMERMYAIKGDNFEMRDRLTKIQQRIKLHSEQTKQLSLDVAQKKIKDILPKTSFSKQLILVC